MKKLKGREFQMEGITCSHNPTINSHRITVFNCVTGKVVQERTTRARAHTHTHTSLFGNLEAGPYS
jgi:hypothetical protein